jgi:hypothetical protein
MNKVFFGTILSQATRQIRCISVNVERAQNNFMTEKHMNIALEELKHTQKLLEEAIESYKQTGPISSKIYLK